MSKLFWALLSKIGFKRAYVSEEGKITLLADREAEVVIYGSACGEVTT